MQRIDDDDDLMSERGSDHGDRPRGRGGRGGYGSDSQKSADDFIKIDGDSLRRHRKHHRGDEDKIPDSAEQDARDVFGV